MALRSDSPNKSTLTITYHGPAVDSGEMDISVLGPALVSLAGFLNTSREILDDRVGPASIRLKGIGKKESFPLELVIEAVQQAPELLEPGMVLAEQLWETGVEYWEEHRHLARYVVKMIRGAIKLARHRGSGKLVRVPTDEKERDERGIVVYSSPVGERVKIEADVAVVLENGAAKPDLMRFLKPVEQEGMTSVVLTSGGESVRIVARDVRDYRYLRLQEREVITTREVLTVLSPSFQMGKVWRVRGKEGEESRRLSENSVLSGVRP